MNIKEYALELGLDPKTIIKSLNELGYTYKSENEMLDDEALIVLDNELGNMSAAESIML